MANIQGSEWRLQVAATVTCHLREHDKGETSEDCFLSHVVGNISRQELWSLEGNWAWKTYQLTSI